ncbi:MAG: EsaB/YukD family protein [Mycobacterium sp.]
MIEERTGLCRVVVYAAGDGADLVLPDDVPVGVLLPELWDTLAALGLHPPPGSGVLMRPGHGPLDPALTLYDNGVRDGAVVAFAPPHRARRPAVVVDAAATVSKAVMEQAVPIPPFMLRRTGFLVASASAGLAGFLAVPGAAGLPHVLLASTAVALVSTRLAADPAGTALTCAGVGWAAVALPGTLADLGLTAAGAIAVLAFVALLTVSDRVAVRIHGLAAAGTDAAELTRRACGARRSAAALRAGSAAGAALGVLVCGVTAPSWAACGFGAATAGVLILRARATPAVPLLICGTSCGGIAVLIAHQQIDAPGWLPSMIAAVLASIAMIFGTNPALCTRNARAVTVAEHVLLVAMAPLACWTLGAFGWVP